jgi:hypothetical protein
MRQLLILPFSFCSVVNYKTNVGLKKEAEVWQEAQICFGEGLRFNPETVVQQVK